MNDLQIKCFLVVAKHLNFSKAADALYISQPAVSRHVINLERELGAELFNRNDKPITLTPAGQAYYDFFSRSTAELAGLKKEFGSAHRANVTTITFALNSIWYLNDSLSQCIDHFEKKHPEIKVSMKQYLSTNIITAFRDEEADLLIHLTHVLENAPDYQYLPIGTVKNIFCYSIKHPLARKSALTLKDFSDAGFVYTDDAETRPASQQHITCKIKALFDSDPDCLTNKVRFFAAPNSDVANSMVEDGHAVIFLDQWARLPTHSTMKTFVTPSDESISLAWKKNRKNDAVRLFADEAAAYFRSHPLWEG